MLKTRFILLIVLSLGLLTGTGCRTGQTGKVMDSMDKDRVGSHNAGAEVFDPLVCSTTGQIIEALQSENLELPTNEGNIQTHPGVKRICFLGIDNNTSEELGDFREHLYQTIDTEITNSNTCVCVNRMAVEGALKDLRLRPNQLFDPINRQAFTQKLGALGQPFDYMLLGTVTSGTTIDNRDSQKNYKLVLECINVNSGITVAKRQADIRKQYNASAQAKMASSKMNPLNWGK